MNHDRLAWRTSSFTGSSGTCVQVAAADKEILVRNSNRIANGALHLPPGTAAAFVAACRAGAYDDLAAHP
jgi:hypothetical protein